MYFPALRLFVSRGILDSLEEQEVASDHSMYELKPTQEGLISMEHLSYIYNKQKTPVLDDVNLTVQKGDFLVITGESGSGKSSLCMAMTGAIPHYFGGVMKGMVYVTSGDDADDDFEAGRPGRCHARRLRQPVGGHDR